VSEICLSVQNLKKYFTIGTDFLGRPTQYLKAVDDVSFDIPQGTTMGLVGESGCGKTTIGRTILRLHELTDGKVIFNGQDLSKLSRRQLRNLRPQIQIIFQDPYSSLSPRLTVGAIIGEAVSAHKIVPRSELKEYVLQVMKDCGLQTHYYERYPHEFSGGQRQRICIARAIALRPRFIVCDEPVSALDVSIQAQIINLLKDLQDKYGYTYLFISHDLSVVEHISDTVGVMYLGNMVEYGSKEDIFSDPLHPYTKALFSAVPMPDPTVKMQRIILQGDLPSPANPPKGCKFCTRCPECMEICKTDAPEFKEMTPGHKVACHLYK
jgi:peptide/nickel transport system ATP-binding protein